MHPSLEKPWLPDEEPGEAFSLLDLARVGTILIVLVLILGIYRGCVEEDEDPIPAFGNRKCDSCGLAGAR
jgi:hypothetical protein